MSEHDEHEMDENSLEAYWEEKGLGKLSRRCTAIIRTLLRQPPLTDRQICERLGFGDMNSVRPRITDMIKEGRLEKTGDTADHITEKTVRLVRIRPREPEPKQASLFPK